MTYFWLISHLISSGSHLCLVLVFAAAVLVFCLSHSLVWIFSVSFAVCWLSTRFSLSQILNWPFLLCAREKQKILQRKASVWSCSFFRLLLLLHLTDVTFFSLAICCQFWEPHSSEVLTCCCWLDFFSGRLLASVFWQLGNFDLWCWRRERRKERILDEKEEWEKSRRCEISFDSIFRFFAVWLCSPIAIETERERELKSQFVIRFMITTTFWELLPLSHFCCLLSFSTFAEAAATAAYQLMCIAANKLPRFNPRLSPVDKVRALACTVVFTLAAAAAAKVVLNFGAFRIFFLCLLFAFWCYFKERGKIPPGFLCPEVQPF